MVTDKPDCHCIDLADPHLFLLNQIFFSVIFLVVSHLSWSLIALVFCPERSWLSVKLRFLFHLLSFYPFFSVYLSTRFHFFNNLNKKFIPSKSWLIIPSLYWPWNPSKQNPTLAGAIHSIHQTIINLLIRSMPWVWNSIHPHMWAFNPIMFYH